MVILPAIDLMENCCVRLRQGRADQRTIYSDNPVQQAQSFRDKGAEHLHVVDLDGAFAGTPKHTAIIAQIIRECGLKVEVGGGLRTDEAVAELMEVGVARAIIGTRALEDTEALARWVQCYGERIAVGIDARGGFVQTRDWVETSTMKATDLAKKVADLGVQTIIYTDTATDGMLGGTNLQAMQEMAQAVPGVKIIASGGVSLPQHVTDLKALGCDNLWGAIVGKAIYEGVTTVEAMIAAANA
ncbi:MAG: 1-(5-phosphoribosyl)-5-[(5-phosphoribosylamino)methylideneamino]imidazole-4-carboxamide isomerase [Kiritimatiellae bacterium]|nr:1-(5-phosphoribosyl)-5-[(5-phosphoribosylamino)methylideneamino]imidazole-4-carboxamide isomerase [Kiritimatiellia bacterium]